MAVLAVLLGGMAAAQMPVAYVYVAQTDPATSQPFPSQPIYAFSVTPDGKVTPVAGSPFTQISGQMVGTTGSHFITRAYGGNLSGGEVPLNYLYSYDVAANGAIGQQVSEINTQLYGGSNCSGAQGSNWPDDAELDHTGRFVYVTYCSNAVQTYALSSAGDLTFKNVSTYSDATSGLPKLTGNDAFGYNQTVINGQYGPVGAFSGFARESDGSLLSIGTPSVTGPSLPSDDFDSLAVSNYYSQYGYFNAPKVMLTNNPTDHLAAMLTILKFTAPDTVSNEGCALASFTVGSQGELTSTNSYDNMPSGCGNDMVLSPSGKYLAVLPYDGKSLQLYHFNGSNPITYFTQVAGAAGWFSTMAWDSSNHLYALDGQSGQLHIYTVTSSSVSEAPGSPYSVPICPYDTQDNIPGCSQKLVVHSVPACTAPSGNGVNVCTPDMNTTTTSPVIVDAAATVSGGVYRFELWNGSTKLLTVRDSGIMNQSVSLASGTYKLTFSAYNSSGTHVYATRDITVK